MDAKFDLLQRGQYTLFQGNSQLAAVDSRTPFGLLEARNAVQIAKAAGPSNTPLTASVRLSNFFSRQRGPWHTGRQKANRNERP